MLPRNINAEFGDYKKRVNAQNAAQTRLAMLFDDGSFTQIDEGAEGGVRTALGKVNGSPVYAFSQNREHKSGAVGISHATKICKVLDMAAKNGLPVVGVYDSCGAFIEDGADAIVSFSRVLSKINNLSGVVPQIAVVAGACVGSCALAACSSDIVVSVKGAGLYMSSPDESDGLLDAVSVTAADERHAFETVRRILSLLPPNNMDCAPEFEFGTPGAATALLEPTLGTLIESIADVGSVNELYGGFGEVSYAALASVGGYAAGLAATFKRPGKLTSDDCSKLARLVRVCDAFSIPVITLIDTEGSIGSARDLAKLAYAYAEATSLKISVVVGKAYGCAFVAFGADNADITYAYPDAVISPLHPLTAVEFLEHDKLRGAADLKASRDRLAAEYCETAASAFAAAEKGVISGVIEPAETRERLISALDAMSNKRLFKRLPKKHGNAPL